MGIYCDPKHPALGQFPARSHSQFQWYSLLTDSVAMNLSKLPFDFEPVVYMIDDFNECERLGLVFEAKVGKGRLLATSLNMGTESSRTLAQKQMLKSLLNRAGSDSFAPAQSLSMKQLHQVFQPPNVKIKKVSSDNRGHEKEKMIDGDPETFWHTRFQPDFAPKPHFVVLEVPADTSVSGLTYVAYSGGNGNGHVKAYSVSVCDDGKTWSAPLIKGALETKVYNEQKIMFPAPTDKKFIKFEITDAVSYGGQPIAAIGELDVLVK
jgi:hypothetical protein